jgi:NAD(P)-dependent dehydrogenase (short-subunit alcohol dehydrogenase family)
VSGEPATPQTPPLRVDGQVAVVTGAGRGIGMGSALALAQAGADVVLVSRTRDELERTAAGVRAAGRRAEVVVCDVSDPEQIAATIAQLERIDILVNSAGTNVPEPFLDVTVESLDRVLGLNVRGSFLVAQAAARRMVARATKGSMIHISSDFGHVGSPLNRSVYCATKHALEGLTRATALELARHGIRVNSVAPTFIETPLTQPFLRDAAFRDEVERSIPLGRIGRIEDVMGAVVFLASPASALVTGTSLLVDGGWTAQ